MVITNGEIGKTPGEAFLMRRWMYVLIALLLAAASCGLFENKKEAEPPPGRRDYTWTVDTLANEPGGFIYDIWGSSPSNVWAGSPTGVQVLWHFDGTRWSPWPHAQQISPGFDITCLYGFARDDVWGGSDNGELYHFNGEIWSVAFTYSIPGMEQPDFTDIWGTSPTDIYVVGRAEPDTATSGASMRSFLLHYNGRSWKQLIVTNFGVQFQRVRVQQGVVFILGTQNALGTYLIYNYVKGHLVQLISKTSDEVYTVSMNDVVNEIYFDVGNMLETYNVNEFDRNQKGPFLPIMALPDSETVVGVSGRNKNDLFIYTFGGVLQYNGINTKYLLRIPEDMPDSPFREMLFKNQVFFTVWDVKYGVTNVIVHGVLSDTTKTE